MLEGELVAVRGEMARFADEKDEAERRLEARGVELAEARRALEEAMSGMMARGNAGSSSTGGAAVTALSERDARENSAAFMERRRQIDDDFRARIAEAPASHQITVKHRGEVGRAMAVGGVGNRQYEENVVPDGEQGGVRALLGDQAGGLMSVSGSGKPHVGGSTSLSGVSARRPFARGFHP